MKKEVIEVVMSNIKVLSNISPEYAYDKSSFIFKGGEVQVKIDGLIRNSSQYYVVANLESSNDIMELLLTTNAIRTANSKADVFLACPYFPYARQDRVMQEGEALSVKVMADLINAQNYAGVIIWDAHSDVTPALINRVTNLSSKILIRPLFREHFFTNENTVLVAPDAGAIKKVAAISAENGIEMVRADKHRDVRTGKITETVVYSEHVGNKDFLIIDDICDGGRTFIELAKKLRPLTNGKIKLYVTHGIFSQGLDVFDGEIDRIYCPNIFSTAELSTSEVLDRSYKVLPYPTRILKD